VPRRGLRPAAAGKRQRRTGHSQGRKYWYYAGYKANGGEGKSERFRKYVGPIDDPAVTARVEAFARIKSNAQERRQMVRSLAAARLPSPAGLVGDVIEELWKAGFFRLRGLLIGTVAFQTYCGFLGVRIPDATTMTGDADFAQFRSISEAVEDKMPPTIEVLRRVDPTFVAVPHVGSRVLSTKYRTNRHFGVEFQTPNRGSDDHQGKPAPMPALGGAGAEPLRYLDFLIHQPVTFVLLHKSGVPITVPAPERYAVHKLIVATHRKTDSNGRLKAQKDMQQAGLLFQALTLERRATDIGFAWIEAWERGPKWQEGLTTGCNRLDAAAAATLRKAVVDACREVGKGVADYWPYRARFLVVNGYNKINGLRTLNSHYLCPPTG
jgi:hypothetical protein